MTSQTESVSRLPGVTYAVSNTGPLISTFQSDSFSLLANLFAEIYIPAACLTELKRHGYKAFGLPRAGYALWTDVYSSSV